MSTKHWTDAELDRLVKVKGFRQRGEQMTRLETFTDAAFAFAVTLVVILVDAVPSNYAEFVHALESVPVFVICFAQLMVFWWGHHVWSRRYGLEGGWDIVLSLALVATVLVYVYPLRAIFTAFVWNLQGDSVQEQYAVTLPEIGHMFLVFGIGFTILAGLVTAHFVRAYTLRRHLGLNPLERAMTLGDAASWSTVALTGFASACLAYWLPDTHKQAAAYAYYTLVITMPLVGYLTALACKSLLPR